ncbi:hypothetical protein DLD82_16385 [Methanospirillum stamsii]|uniref:Fe/B12 periplasmic-binding domain-containing protein n=1 Tax=Methanospirillum stamsii TaxID=1277351 RepID=A0A2V2N116_9EURY|nr:hypothetical protein DLD82_16385 [Methanospirillum stamsii]
MPSSGSDPSLQSVNAIKNGNVHYIRVGWQGNEPESELTECFYLANLFYPEQSSGLNAESEGNKILNEFYGEDGLYSWVIDRNELSL